MEIYFERMKALLKINHILFWWYYRKVSDHFKGYTFFESIRILRQNYEHGSFIINGQDKLIITYRDELEKLRKENSQLKISQIATDGQIRWANKAFGTDWTPPTEN